MTYGSITRCECGMVQCDGYALHDLRMQGNKDRAALERVARQDQREAALKDKDLAEREARHAARAARAVTGETDTPDPFDWGIRNLADLASEPAPIHAVQGLLIQGALTMLYSPPKTGKTRLLFAMLKALSTGGPDFLGQQLPDIPTLIFTEETPSLLGEHVRRNQIPAEAGHHVNTLTKMFGPADFCQEIYRTYTEAGGGFGIIAVDTLGAFCRFNDINDYGQVAQVMAPFRELARQLPQAAFLLSHHQNKAGGDGWDSALGSTALTSNVDQIIRLRRHKGKTTLAIGGRYNPEPLPFDKPIAIDIGAEGVKLLGNASDDAADMILANMPAGAPLTVRTIRESMGEDAPSEGSFNRALKDLVSEGYIDKLSAAKGNQGAVYQIPE